MVEIYLSLHIIANNEKSDLKIRRYLDIACEK